MPIHPSQSTRPWFATSTVALLVVVASALGSFFIHLDHAPTLHTPLQAEPALPAAGGEWPQFSVPVDDKTRMNTVSWAPVGAGP